MNAPFYFAADAALRTAFPGVKGRLLFVALIIAGLAALLPSVSFAQSPGPGILFTQHQELAGIQQHSEYFGYHVAAHGDTLVVGTGSNKRIYVFTRGAGGWTLQQQFTANYHDQQSGYVAVHGDTLVAGGIIYTRSGGVWTLQQTLDTTNDDPRFALQGDTLVYGDPYPTQPTQNQDGNVKVYVRSGTTWNLQATLTPSFQSRENMGYTVALDGDTLLAGIHTASMGPGGAYVFVRSGTTWSQQARLVLPTGAAWMTVALEGDTAAIGDPGNNRIHVFNRTGTSWSLTQTLTLPAGGGNYLGDEIALSGGIIAASAESQVHLYARTPSGWIHAQSLVWPDRAYPSITLANRGKLFARGNFVHNRGSFGAAGGVDVYSVPPPPAPGSGWRDADIGAVGVAGSSTDNGSTVSVRGSGSDIWERVDQFHFRSETLTGDGAIIARVDSAGSGHPWSKVGLMAREDVAPTARNVMALVTPGSHLGTQARAATAATTTWQDAGWIGAPIWLMLARSGNLFATYRSNDGDNWTPMGSATVEMPATIHVGLAVSSHNNAVLNTGTFFQIEIVGNGPPPGAPNPPSNLTGSLVASTSVRLRWTDQSSDETGFVVERSRGSGGGTYATVATTAANATEYTDTGLAANTTYTYRVKAARGTTFSAPSNTFTITTTSSPETLTGSQLGATPVNGSFSLSGGLYTVDAAGADIWNNQDSGYFVHRELTGDFDLRTRVTSLSNTHPWAKAGVMVRESLDAGARNLFMLLTAGNVAGLQVRDVTNGSTRFISGPWVRAPYWVRLKRTGNTFEAFIFADGAHAWQPIGSATLALPATVRAGVAVSSHVDGTTTRATFDGIHFN